MDVVKKNGRLWSKRDLDYRRRQQESVKGGASQSKTDAKNNLAENTENDGEADGFGGTWRENGAPNRDFEEI